ncbi:MAG: ribosome small subunit-dependent GTPase A [Chloroflexi bacterium]|nr:MAG: ribosome small subunit-dependent GTPase A [Chloroflexota bacterium]MBL1197086.1 ribosome small subunit-dependent GTPase A [Chloroflexota bacterium]NOH14381.1 ribosome small subunit-dependent GTPase A [Chloroflexota bacterium]
MSTEQQPGVVLRSQSGFFVVKTEQGEVQARLRGRLKQGRKTVDLVAIGDVVEVSTQPDGRNMIESIKERKSKLSRMAPTARGEYEQIIVSNLDQAVFVFACADPQPRLRMLDRFLVIAEVQEIPAVIVANKVDLVGKRAAKEIFGHYPTLGYPVIYTSADKKDGIKALKKQLAGVLSVFAGPSGVGKSSLLNLVLPELALDVSEVSESTGKGTHTTVFRQLFPLGDGGYVADTPGLKALALWDVEPEELDGYFPELAPLVPDCQFSNCSHIDEPGCAVLAAVETGEINPARYESYVRLRTQDEE